MAIRVDVTQDVTTNLSVASVHPLKVTHVNLKANQGILPRLTLIGTTKENTEGQPFSDANNATTGVEAVFVLTDEIDTDIEDNTYAPAYETGDFPTGDLYTADDYVLTDADKHLLRMNDIYVTDAIAYPAMHGEVEE